MGRRLRLERYQFDPSRAGLCLDIFGSLVLDAAKLYEGSVRKNCLLSFEMFRMDPECQQQQQQQQQHDEHESISDGTPTW